MGLLDDISKAVSDTVKTVSDTVSGGIESISNLTPSLLGSFSLETWTMPFTRPSTGITTEQLQAFSSAFTMENIQKYMPTFPLVIPELIAEPIIEPIIEPKPVVLEEIVPWVEEIPETIVEAISPWEEFEEVIPIIKETLLEEPSVTRLIKEIDTPVSFEFISPIQDILKIPDIPVGIPTPVGFISLENIETGYTEILSFGKETVEKAVDTVSGITDPITGALGLPSKIAKYLLIGGGLIAGITLIYFLVKRRSPSIIDEVLGIVPEEAGVKGAKGKTKIKTKLGTFEQTGTTRGVKVKMK